MWHLVTSDWYSGIRRTADEKYRMVCWHRKIFIKKIIAEKACTTCSKTNNKIFPLTNFKRNLYFLLSFFSYLLSYLLTYLLSYLLTYLPYYVLTYLLAYLLIYLLIYLLTYLLTCFLTYFLTYILTFLLSYLLSFLLTYLLTPWSRVLLEKLTGFQPVKKFPAFHGTRKYITAFTSARHLSLSWTSSIQSIPPHPTSWRPILILSSHRRLGLPSSLFPSGLSTKTMCTLLLSRIRVACTAHLILLDFITQTTLGEKCRSFIYIYIYIYIYKLAKMK